MNIVHIEDFFHPDAGYQVNVLGKYQVQQGHRVTVIAAEMEKIPAYLTSFFGRDHIEERDRAYEEAYGVRIMRLPLRRFVSGRAIFAPGLLDAVRACSPDIVYAHGNDTFTGMWVTWNRKKFGCPLVLDSHMLEMASSNPLRKAFRVFYRAFVAPIIRREKLTVIRTQDDTYVERCLGIPLSQAPWISYGSDTMLFHPDPEQKQAFRREHGISEDAFVVVYAGKLDDSKGGKLLADLTCAPLRTDREVVWLVVGNAAGEYGAEVEAGFQKSPCRVLRFPTQKYSDLAVFYQAADLAVFPKQCSLSFYDVQACGLPVLSENNNINVDRCSHGNGWNFREGDLKDFAEKLEEIVNLPKEQFAKIAANAAAFIKAEYDYEEKAREYERVLLDAVDRAQKR